MSMNSRNLVYCAILLALPGGIAVAEDAPPPALQSMPEPEMKASFGATFRLNDVVFSGNTRVADSELRTLAEPWLDREVALADLEDIAARVTALYRERGFFLAQAVVPVQDVIQGRVTIGVVEGALGRIGIDVADDAPISVTRVQATLSDLQPGQPVDGRGYERAMLLLSDLPGIRAQSAIEIGAAGGTSDLSVEVTRADPITLLLETDNHGTPESGRIRLGGTLRWASPTGRGDNLDLRAMVAEDADTVFGRIAYEAPVGYRGIRVGAGLARVQYELGGAFRALDASGTADIADVSATFPLVRQRGTNLLLRAGLDRKALSDELEAVGLETDKHVHGASLSLAFEHRDAFLGGGYSSLGVVLYRGKLNLRDELSEILDRSSYGRNTRGYFNKTVLRASRLQYLAPGLSVHLGVGLQQSNRNLDASEQLSLGGPRAVRAYSSNEALVDEGWIANLELRYAAGETLTPYLFYDAAHGARDHNRHRLAAVNGESLRGYGLGLSLARPGSYSLNATVAWRDGDRATADARDPHLYLQFQKSF